MMGKNSGLKLTDDVSASDLTSSWESSSQAYQQLKIEQKVQTVFFRRNQSNAHICTKNALIAKISPILVF
jgi:hypothetical protein